MARRLLGAKQLFEPMLLYCQLHHKEHIFVKFYQKFQIFIQENVLEKCLRKGGHFVSTIMCF